MERLIDREERDQWMVLSVLLTFMPGTFNGDTNLIQRGIAELQNKDEYRELLGGFDFVESHLGIYSCDLDQELGLLEEVGLLKVEEWGRDEDGRHVTRYHMPAKSKQAIRSRMMEKFSPEEQGTLKRIAGELGEILTIS